MAGNAATAFITGADGFIGRELVKVLVGGGHPVFGLAHSTEAAQRLRDAGAVAVMGDLLESGQWQDEAAADWVFHIPRHAGGARVAADARLLDTLAIRMHEFADTSARLANRPLRAWTVPAAMTRLVVGRVLADQMRIDAVFSNIRLRGIGFHFRYPTLEPGLRQVLRALNE